MNKEEFVAEIGKLRPGSTFLVLHKYMNAHGEIADFNIIFNMSYENALRRSIAVVEQLSYPPGLKDLARKQVLESFEKSLQKVLTVPVDEQEDNYKHLYDEQGKLINGIKLHIESATLHLFGLVHMKRIHKEGLYKEVKSADLTLAKNEIRRLCPVSKFRQFKIEASQLEHIAVQKLTLLPPDK